MLGFVAVFVALVFALVKFLTTVHMRRLYQQRLRTRTDLNKITQRLSSLEDSLQVERASQASTKRKIVAAIHFKESLHKRLLIELPDRLQHRLSLCIDRNPVPETTGVKLFHELNLAEKIAETLSDLSVAVFQFPTDDDAANAVLKGEFIRALEKAHLRYAPGSSVRRSAPDLPADLDFVVCVFDGPAAALDMLCQFIEDLSDERVTQIHGALVSGIGGTADDDPEGIVGRFARSLDRCQELAESAPPATLLFNEVAYDSLLDRQGVKSFSAPDGGLFAFSWKGPSEKTTQVAEDSGGDLTEGARPLSDDAAPEDDDRGPRADLPKVETRT